MSKKINFENYFKLSALKSARVSDISEATASSSVSENERVNFHIGNPIQDERLYKLYLQTISDLPFYSKEDFETTLSSIEIEERKKTQLRFFFEAIKNASPYMPRGGYNSKNPTKLIKYFHEWITSKQEDKLEYGIGGANEKREIAILSGGFDEALRIFFHSVNEFFLQKPVKILLYETEIPSYVKDFKNLSLEKFTGDDNAFIDKLETKLKGTNEPVFFVCRSILTEEIRRELRRLSSSYPIFFIEINNAANSQSLAREAGLKNSVIRFLTAKSINNNIKKSSIVFAAGNSEYIKLLETIHFQIKGTPSSTECDLLYYQFSNNTNKPNPDIDFEEFFESNLTSLQKDYSVNIESIFNRLENISSSVSQKSSTLLNKNIGSTKYLNNKFDSYSGFSRSELFKKLLTENPLSYSDELAGNFLSQFIKHHDEYEISNSFVVSGSSRTALGLLGFHCGISEVITNDFSWTYEHCFPKTTVVPLNEDQSLNINNFKKAVEATLHKKDKSEFAVVLNNPHNATGNVFDESTIKELLTWLLSKDIFVIDDLSYQNVAPSYEQVSIKTLKQIVDELILTGYISFDKSKHLITVHSLSKTDCFAGARLAVVNIDHPDISKKFEKLNKNILPNNLAILLAYLFYRSDENVNQYWSLRNKIFKERIDAIKSALYDLSDERNEFNISISTPKGSMYPALTINNLPQGISLDWLSTNLANQGIGILSLTSFARTSEGYDLARKTFRLTLGGKDGSDVLKNKTRRLIIDLSRIIGEEQQRYLKQSLPISNSSYAKTENEKFTAIKEKIFNEIKSAKTSFIFVSNGNNANLKGKFISEFLPERLKILENKIHEKKLSHENSSKVIIKNKGQTFIEKLKKEFYKESLEERQTKFRNRLYDRTVHPTQMYSLEVDILFDKLADSFIEINEFDESLIKDLTKELINEFIGVNVAIKSHEEGFELVNDLYSLTACEDIIHNCGDDNYSTFLSFWGDWDGSTRPSGQGHRLVASVLVENVNNQAKLIKLLLTENTSIKIDVERINEIEELPSRNVKFWELLNKITQLTNSLEKRYQSILPYNIKAGRIFNRNPLKRIYAHNDRTERKMRTLRAERTNQLEYYFSLNKTLRKILYNNIDVVEENLGNSKIVYEFAKFKNLLSRFVLTPRIHQKIITDRDQFSINTTVHNLMEINEISGKYGNPGMIMGLQISMSTDSKALISLDRKLNAKLEELSVDNKNIPNIWIIPLFEEYDTVLDIKNYLNDVWNYSIQSRKINQSVEDRFAQIMCEVFIAGSDLSQQIGQTASADLYKRAKLDVINFISEKGIADKMRMKLGSGEPMQRQGGYYSDMSGEKAFNTSGNYKKALNDQLKESTITSMGYAATPLLGIHSNGEFRTLQSNISEKINHLEIFERSNLIYHIIKSQKSFAANFRRATEPLINTRYKYKEKGKRELERITTGIEDEHFNEFVRLTTENFRQILYGNENDSVGIHSISYFISRTTPPLRDRPTVRPTKQHGNKQGQQILERIAELIPLSKHGSLLRAIGHNRSQSTILGINQLTTGLFRALKLLQQSFSNESEALRIIKNRILPKLPVYEILHTVRMYNDPELFYLNKFRSAFSPGNTALLSLREDFDAVNYYLRLFQMELLRRHGINESEFFDNNGFKLSVIPYLRPDLAVLLQPDLFNQESAMITPNKSRVEENWLNEIEQLLAIPNEINYWRDKTWQLIFDSIYSQVESFNELAMSLNTISNNYSFGNQNVLDNKLKVESKLSDLLKGSTDDSMKQFLGAAIQYLSNLPQNNIEVPFDVLRALKDVEKILLIDKQALTSAQQKELNFYILQMARAAGENG